MTPLLKRPKNQIFKAFSQSHFTNDAQFAGYSSVHEKSSSRIQGRISSREAEVLNSSSLPLSCLLNDHSTCSIYYVGYKIPCFLPHPIRANHFQEKMQLIALPKSGFLSISARFCLDLHSGRGYCNVSGNVDSDDEKSAPESCSKNAENVKSQADPGEVERVYKVIHELFALDRNMEAVLDECGVRISHDLVVDVLDRFKHAWKPAFRFFCWSSRIDPSVYAHDSRTYNAMMSILGKNRQFETMVSILDEMGQKGMLNVETFIISMKSFAAAKERKKAIGIFELMKKYDFCKN